MEGVTRCGAASPHTGMTPFQTDAVRATHRVARTLPPVEITPL